MRPPARRIGQEPSTFRRDGLPILVVLAGSLMAMLPIISTASLMPPFGLLALLAWRQLHRAIWPVWIPVPLGLFDDLYSGQPLGSSMLLWTLAFLILDMVDRRFIWRTFREEWLIASALIAGCVVLGLAIANMTGGGAPLWSVVPQIVISILAYPWVVRMCAHIDQWRF